MGLKPVKKSFSLIYSRYVRSQMLQWLNLCCNNVQNNVDPMNFGELVATTNEQALQVVALSSLLLLFAFFYLYHCMLNKICMMSTFSDLQNLHAGFEESPTEVESSLLMHSLSPTLFFSVFFVSFFIFFCILCPLILQSKANKQQREKTDPAWK